MRVALALVLTAVLGCADAAAPAGPDPAAPAPSWRLVASWEGGPAWAWLTTDPFTVAAPWRVRWSGSGSGALFVDLYQADGTLVGRIGEQQADGSGATAPRTAAGTYRLELRSTLWAWSVVVEDAP